MRLGPFIRQCRELAQVQIGSVDGIIGGYLSSGRTHPHVAMRVYHLVQWVEHGSYLSILAGHYPPRPRRRDEARTRTTATAAAVADFTGTRSAS
jgi:hypothetical protein